MAGTVLDKVAGYLDKRFVLTAFFPALAFWLAVLTFVAAESGWTDALDWWKGRDVDEQRLIVVAAAALVTLSASLLSVQIGALTRLHEGYWGSGCVGRALAAPGRWLQLRRYWKLKPHERDADYERRYRLFPRESGDVLPTRFGNVLRGAEKYPGDEGRYGIDAVFFWPRLSAVLGEHTRAALADARSSMDLLMTISALAWTYAIGAAAYLLLAGGSPATWALAVGGALVLARITYRGAVSAAVVFAENVRAAFDLHRLELLDKLGYKRPGSLEDERRIWIALGQRLYRRGTSDDSALTYAPPSTD